MDDVENQSVIEEAAPPETSQQQEATPAQQESRQDRNWREMRRVNDELRRKAEMQEEMLKRLMQQQPQVNQAPAEEALSIGDEDYLQGSHLKKWQAQTEAKARKMAREEAESMMQERDKMRFRERLKERYPDFDEIVNPETLSLLEESDPDLASTIADLKDPYKIGLQSYKYLKASGLIEKTPEKRRTKEVEKRLDENAKSVVSPQTFNKRPMAQAFQMSKAEKKDLYREMMGYASQVGGSY